LFIGIWLACGFAIAVLCRSIFRGSLTGAIFAAVLALAAGACWVPSIFTGGMLPAWSVWAGPAVLFGAALVLLRERAAERPRNALQCGAALLAVVAAAGFQAATLWYRAVEMPESSNAFDIDAYRASLPSEAENQAGRLTASALRRLAVVRGTFDRTPLAKDDRLRDARAAAIAKPFPTYFLCLQQVEDVAAHGWRPSRDLAAPFLDVMFEDDWAKDLAAASELPTGVAFDPRELNLANSPDLFIQYDAGVLLVARGLQLQADDHPEGFVAKLRMGLSLARNIQHRSPPSIFGFGRYADWRVLRGVERWLERLDGRPDLLRQALEIIRRHCDESTIDVEDLDEAQCLVALNSVDNPTTLLRGNIGQAPDRTDPFFLPYSRLPDQAILRVCWQAPWEQIRVRRVLDGLLSDDANLRNQAKSLCSPLLRQAVFASNQARIPDGIKPDHYYGRDHYVRQLTLLQVALRLYREERHRPAEKLSDLVPDYLPRVPLDPLDSKPVRYRLSRGEVLQEAEVWDTVPGSIAVAPGQGILWCLADDAGVDHGGHVIAQGTHFRQRRDRGDFIFLEPMPPGKK
jgi:hypothetical protein